jgi:hypothetical protein
MGAGRLSVLGQYGRRLGSCHQLLDEYYGALQAGELHAQLHQKLTAVGGAPRPQALAMRPRQATPSLGRWAAVYLLVGALHCCMLRRIHPLPGLRGIKFML